MDKVYYSSADCCGCGICMITCPKNAISMKCDEKGFVYPAINSSSCVDCGACKRICSFIKRKKADIGESYLGCYAACNKNHNELHQSTSGGVFSAVAHSFLEQGGVVAGACMELKNRKVHVYHKLIDTKEELPDLQGSKYVQSNLWECVDKMEALLNAGKNVLFSGTPCQVDAIKGKFSKYLETQLFTIDVVCHGVPNKSFFESFLEEYQKRENLKLKKIIFRDKKNGWGHKGSLVTEDNRIIAFTRGGFSFYNYFIEGEISRESCYFCPYACLERVGDITVGDYWGIKNYDPQLLTENGGAFDFKMGVSCLIVNNTRGEELLKRFGSNLQKAPIQIQHIMQINTQLREPSKHTKLRNKIFSLYIKQGYCAVEKLFERQMLYKKIKKKIKTFIPKILLQGITGKSQ